MIAKPTPPDQDANAGTDSAVGWQAPMVDLLVVTATRWRLIVTVLSLVLILGLGRYLTTPSYYRASAVAVLMPREKHAFDVSINTGSVETTDDTAKRDATGTLMLPSQPDLYITLLRSRPVLRSLARRFHDRLTKPLTPLRSDELVLTIGDMVKIDCSDEGLLTVTVTSSDPVFAADLANAVIAEGERASKAIERQLFLQQAGYIDQARIATQQMLNSVEAQLKEFTGRHTIINPQAQASDRIRQIREVSATRDSLDRELARRRYSYRESDPEIHRLQAEIQSCNQRLKQLNARAIGNAALKDVGGLVVDYNGLIERVKYQRDLVSSLTAQAEVFRIRAEQPAGSIAVIHPAVADDRPAGPSKKKHAGLYIGIGLFLAIGLAIVSDQWGRARRDPYVAQRLTQLEPFVQNMRTHLKWKSHR